MGSERMKLIIECTCTFDDEFPFIPTHALAVELARISPNIRYCGYRLEEE